MNKFIAKPSGLVIHGLNPRVEHMTQKTRLKKKNCGLFQPLKFFPLL